VTSLTPTPAAMDGAIRLDGDRVRLVPIEAGALPYLFSLATSPVTGRRWRYRGAMPSYDEFCRDLWHLVLAQFLVVDAGAGGPIGQVLAHSANLRSGHTRLGVLTSLPPEWGSEAVGEAVGLFVTYLFDTWNLRKLYYMGPPGDAAVVLGERIAVHLAVEGMLREYEWYGGAWQDLEVLALYRDRWPHAAPAARPA
jgi:RimJ/RimL family protein N-acetyltransferase